MEQITWAYRHWNYIELRAITNKNFFLISSVQPIVILVLPEGFFFSPCDIFAHFWVENQREKPIEPSSPMISAANSTVS